MYKTKLEGNTVDINSTETLIIYVHKIFIYIVNIYIYNYNFQNHYLQCVYYQ
jgi:hypothetical protein